MKKSSGFCSQRLTSVVIPIIALLFIMPPVIASALWGDLKPGQYAIGFETIEEYDYSRLIMPKKDYLGEPQEGDRARPIQACIWYPATDVPDATMMVLGDYVFPIPNDNRFYRVVSEIQRRELRLLGGLFQGDQGRMLDAISIPVAAIRDAPHETGAFPLIIYFPDATSGIAENMVLCEYLASNGFVVAMTHSMGTAAAAPEKNQADMETFIRDREFAISILRDRAYIDNEKLGVIGTGMGGLAALILQMRNFDVDAVVGLGGWNILSEHVEFALANPFFDAHRMTVPQMQFYRGVDQTYNLTLVDSCRYSNRCLVKVSDTIPRRFTCYGAIRTIGSSDEENPEPIHRPDYDACCRYVLNFLRANLNEDENARSFLTSTPADNGIDPSLIAITRQTAEEIPPTGDELVGIIRNHGAERAAEIFDKFQALSPGSIMPPEATMNMLGYRFLQSGQSEQSLIVFRINAESYPESPNCWDSYADGAQGAGDNQLAIKCYRKVLETLPNSTIDEQLRGVLKTNAESGIERLTNE